MDLRFDGTVLEWRGPAPYYFVRIPVAQAEEIAAVAAMASYGWGCIPVSARIDDVGFTTSLFPKDGGYLLPLKAAVRKAVGLDEGAEVRVELTVQFAG